MFTFLCTEAERKWNGPILYDQERAPTAPADNIFIWADLISSFSSVDFLTSAQRALVDICFYPGVSKKCKCLSPTLRVLHPSSHLRTFVVHGTSIFIYSVYTLTHTQINTQTHPRISHVTLVQQCTFFISSHWPIEDNGISSASSRRHHQIIFGIFYNLGIRLFFLFLTTVIFTLSRLIFLSLLKLTILLYFSN